MYAASRGNEEGEGEYVFFFQSSSTWKLGLFPLQKTEFPMGPARSCGGRRRRRRQSTSRSPSQIDHLIPAAGEEYSLVPPPVHPVDIDLQPAPQLPPYSLAQKDAAGEPGKTLRPGHAEESARGHRPHYRDACDSVFAPCHPRAMGSRPQPPSQLGCSGVVHLPSPRSVVLKRALSRGPRDESSLPRCSLPAAHESQAPNQTLASPWLGGGVGALGALGSPLARRMPLG